MFRSVRNVESMKVSVDLSTTTPHVVFQFMCKFGTIPCDCVGGCVPMRVLVPVRLCVCVCVCVYPACALARAGITKTHSLVFEDCEIFQAVFRQETAPNRWDTAVCSSVAVSHCAQLCACF